MRLLKSIQLNLGIGMFPNGVSNEEPSLAARR